MPTGANNFLMQFFDGCVFSYPAGQVSISRYAIELHTLGYSGFVVAGIDPGLSVSSPVQVWYARHLEKISTRHLAREAGRPAADNELVYVTAGDSGYNRTVLSTSGVNALLAIENTQKDSFDRYCAKLAADRNIAIGIAVRPLIELRGVARQKVIRKYEEIFTLQRRYEFPLIFSSHASDLLHLRSPRALSLLIRSIWDDEELIARGLTSIPTLKESNSPVREV